MKIGIDASRAFIKKRTGTEEYSYQLIKNLTKIASNQHLFFLYIKKNQEIDFNLPKNFIIRKICYNKLWTQIGLSLEIKKNSIDILFIPSHSVSIFHPKNTIVTIHGLEFKYFPKSYSLKEKFFLEINTLISVKWSNQIIVPSKNTKKDLIKFYKINPNKIKVVHHGVLDRNQKIKIKDKNIFNILFIGRIEKRKNIINLIKAFNLFKKKQKLSSKNYILTMIGKAGFGFEEVKMEIKKSQFKKNIILKDYVSGLEKERLYKQADLFVFLSFYEGFGLPVLEAMSYGIPVICSHTSSLPEIVGNAALTVNPNNIEEISKAFDKISTDDNLKNTMITKGFNNLKRFSWDKCAKETIKIILS